MEQTDPVKYLSIGASVCLFSWNAEILRNLQAVHGLIPKGASPLEVVVGVGRMGQALGKIRF